MDVRGTACYVDPGARRLSSTDRGEQVGALGLRGFEDAEVWGRSVTLLGTDGPNRLGAVARKIIKVAGLAGADRIRLGLNSSRGVLPHDDRLARGGKGRDTLTGTSRRDALFGGGGRDVANGGAAVDQCVTEVRRNCEIP